jgi:hypothetical protein
MDGTKATYCSVLRSHDAESVLSVEVVRGDEVYSGEINGDELEPDPGRGGGGGTESAPPGTSMDNVIGAIPEEYREFCEPSEVYYEGATEAAICEGVEGIDAMWFELFPDGPSVEKAVAGDVRALDAVEDDCNEASTTKSTHEEYTLDIDGVTVESKWHKLICYVTEDGAWMVQADPYGYVIWTGLFNNGDIAALDEWWLANPTILTYTEPQ